MNSTAVNSGENYWDGFNRGRPGGGSPGGDEPGGGSGEPPSTTEDL